MHVLDVRRGRLRTSLYGFSAMAAALASQAAYAQPAADTDAVTAEGDEILVTASRREERAMDVPVAITALGGDKLAVANSSGLDIRFLSARTPSLLVESSFGRTFPRFYIRGLGNTDFDPNAAQPVAVYYDDVVLENPMLKSFPVFDVASVEVLRGPQGTLFGRNSPAGVVKITSAKPTDTFTGHANLSWGTFNTVNGEAAVGGPIAQGLSFRVSGMLQRREPWVTNVSTGATSVVTADQVSIPNRSPKRLEGYRDFAGRAQIAYTSGDFDALLNVHARDLKGTARVFRAASITPGTNDFAPGFDVRKVTLDAANDQRLTAWGANLHLSYHFDGIGTLYSVTGYESLNIYTTSDIDGGDRYDTDGFPYFPRTYSLGQAAFAVETGNATRPKEFSQELRFASDDLNGLRLQGGLYYFHQDLKYDETDLIPNGTSAGTTPAGAPPATVVADGTVYGLITHANTNENYGVFGSAEYKATDRLTLRAGVRYSHDKKHDFTNRVRNPRNVDFGFPVGVPLPNRTFDVSASGSNVSFDASATYKATEEVNIYARFATGYQGPAIEDRVALDNLTTTAPSEKVYSGEVGIKTNLFDKKLRFDLTGYYYRVKDFQQTAVGGGGNTANLISIDEVEGYGVEAEFEARPVDNLVLSASGSYTHTEIKDPGLFVATCGGGCTVTNPTFVDANFTTQAFINGNALPQAQKWIGNASAKYSVPVSDTLSLFAYADVAYTGSAQIFLYESVEFKTKPFTEVGLRVGFNTEDGVEVAGFVRNLLDQIRVTSAVDFNNITTMVNEPRTYGVSISKRF
ncbi:MAG TPA: TonB-dependent receptor [Sphingobium sp.]